MISLQVRGKITQRPKAFAEGCFFVPGICCTGNVFCAVSKELLALVFLLCYCSIVLLILLLCLKTTLPIVKIISQ